MTHTDHLTEVYMMLTDKQKKALHNGKRIRLSKEQLTQQGDNAYSVFLSKPQLKMYNKSIRDKKGMLLQFENKEQIGANPLLIFVAEELARAAVPYVIDKGVEYFQQSGTGHQPKPKRKMSEKQLANLQKGRGIRNQNLLKKKQEILNQ